MVKTERTINGVTSKEERFYISSIKNDIKLFSKAARKHWGVENSLHWCMKVSFRDDESRIRSGNAPINCVILKHISLNLLKQEKTLKRGIKGKKLEKVLSPV